MYSLKNFATPNPDRNPNMNDITPTKISSLLYPNIICYSPFLYLYIFTTSNQIFIGGNIMAKKSITEEVALDKLMEVVNAIGCVPKRVNQTLIFNIDDKKTINLYVSDALWQIAFEKHLKEFEEVDVNDDIGKEYRAELNTMHWIDIPGLEKIYAGESFNINFPNGEFIELTKELLPIKLKKSEFNNISYGILNKEISNRNITFFIIRKIFSITDEWSFNLYKPYLFI